MLVNKPSKSATGSPETSPGLSGPTLLCQQPHLEKDLEAALQFPLCSLTLERDLDDFATPNSQYSLSLFPLACILEAPIRFWGGRGWL